MKVSFQNVIDDLHNLKITFVSPLNDCLLEVKHEQGEDLNKKLLYNKDDRHLIDEEFDHKTSICSRIMSEL